MGFSDWFYRFVASVLGRYTKRHASKFLWTERSARASSHEISIDTVKEFYERSVDLEGNRLKKSLCARIEFEVIKRFLDKHLPSSGRILDIGCGTGPYLCHLAKKGYRVSGIDLSRPAIECARRYLSEARLMGNVDYLHEGNAIDLSMFQDRSFDAVLSFGPFYHILDITLRERALSEIIRVLHPGGIVFATFLSRFAPVIVALELYPNFFNEPAFSETLSTGIRFAGGSRYWTDIYTALPKDVKTFFNREGFQKVCIAAVEGVAAWRTWSIERGFRDDTTFQNLINTLVSIAEEPSLIGATVSMLYIGTLHKESKEKAESLYSL